jgi:hypothetical protein
MLQQGDQGFNSELAMHGPKATRTSWMTSWTAGKPLSRRGGRGGGGGLAEEGFPAGIISPSSMRRDIVFKRFPDEQCTEQAASEI